MRKSKGLGSFKYLTIVFVILTSQFHSLAQVAFKGENEKFGFKNSAGQVVIPPTYDWADDFVEGIARVSMARQYGAINTSGQIIIPIKYTFIDDFSEGLSRAELEGKSGYINTLGEIVIPFRYDPGPDRYRNFSGGLAQVSLKGKTGYINNKGKEVIPIKYQTVSKVTGGVVIVGLDGLYGLVSLDGKKITPLTYNYISEFKSGLAQFNDRSAGRSGFLSPTGKELPYGSSGEFSEGLAAVSLNGKYGYIDSLGNEVIPVKYKSARKFSEGLAAVEIDNKWAYIDKTGKNITDFKYAFAEDFKEGTAAVRIVVEANPVYYFKYGYVDRTGKDRIYDKKGNFFEGMAAVKLDGKWGFIDQKAREVVALKYDSVEHFNLGLAKVSTGDRWKYIDTQGNTYDVSTGQAVKTFKTSIGEIETYRHSNKGPFRGIGIRYHNKDLLLLPYFDSIQVDFNAIVCRSASKTVNIDLKNLKPYEIEAIQIKEKERVACSHCDGEGKVYIANASAGSTRTVTKYRTESTYERRWNPNTNSYQGYRTERSVPYQTIEQTNGTTSLKSETCAFCKGAGRVAGIKNGYIVWDALLYKYDQY